MRVWAALSQKGGSGKSTLVLHLAIAALAEKRITSVIDLDPQKSAEKWASLREETVGQQEPVVVHAIATKLPAMLESARKTKHQLVLIDTPPVIDQTTIYAAAAANLIIVPTRASILDKQALDDSLSTLKMQKALQKVVVVLNAAGSDANARSAILDLARKEHKVPVLDVELEDRPDFRRSLGLGKGITEHAPKGAAAQELTKVFKLLWRWDAKLAKTGKRGT